MEKSIHELKAEFMFLILWKKKISSLEITVIINKDVRNLNLLFKSAEILTKPFFFLFTLETVLKMANETNKGDVESISAKVTKHIKKGC